MGLMIFGVAWSILFARAYVWIRVMNAVNISNIHRAVKARLEQFSQLNLHIAFKLHKVIDKIWLEWL